MRIGLRLGLAGLAWMGVAAACGGRSGIGLADFESASGLDAAAAGGSGGGNHDGGIVPQDGSGERPADTSATDSRPQQDTAVDQGSTLDGFPIPDSGPIADCYACITGKCGQAFNACFGDPACQSGYQCVLRTCMTGGADGGINAQCAMGCFGGNMIATMEALALFQCLGQNCISQCASLGDAGIGF